MVDATVDIYQTITLELLPIPAKSHYTFNVRDLAKVFQGVSMASPDRTFLFLFLANWQQRLMSCVLSVCLCLRVYRD